MNSFIVIATQFIFSSTTQAKFWRSKIAQRIILKVECTHETSRLKNQIKKMLNEGKDYSKSSRSV